MKLSIIVPVYRVEQTLDRCIGSIVNQSFRDFELLLIDDGSPDRCPQLCDEWAARDERIRVIHRPNGGLSAARNTGIEAAKGDYLAFVDSDDYLGDNTLADVIHDIGDSDLLEFPVWRFYGSTRQSLLSFADKTYADVNDYWLDTQAYLHSYACNKLYRRSLFSEVRYPERRVFEDAYTLPRLLHCCQQVKTTSRGRYYYCWNEGGITATAGGNELRQLLEAHLSSDMPVDDCYYMHLLNIQMDVCEFTGDEPLLQRRFIMPRGSIKQITKSIMLNILGIKGICTINKLIHRLCR